MPTVLNVKNSNYQSVLRTLQRLFPESALPTKETHLIIPGVSSFDAAVFATKEAMIQPTSFSQCIIGICAGAQILFESSEEGNERGLGLFPGRIKKITTNSNITVPHLGWNKVILNENHPMAHLFDGIDLENKKFYFSHSYRFPDSEHALAYVDYGEKFPVVVAKDNLIAIQFHPEKSYGQGLQFLKNICEL